MKSCLHSSFSHTRHTLLHWLPHFSQNSEVNLAEIVHPHKCDDYGQSAPNRKLKSFESEENIY